MHSDLSAAISIINNPDFNQDHTLQLIDGIIAQRAASLIYTENDMVIPFDINHASMTGLIILRNRIVHDPELVGGLSYFSVNSLAGEITSAAIRPSSVRLLDIGIEAAGIDDVQHYVDVLSILKTQADNLSEHVFNTTTTPSSEVHKSLI